jgi:UDP-N-acetylmuramoylalanine--D-glutamate ligase
MESKLDEISAEISPPHPIKIIRQDRMEIAVLEASRIAVPGDIVLLAPGGTSFDAFTDFSQRGEVFRDLVNDIATGSYFIVATG